MNRQEYILFLVNLGNKGITGDSKDEVAYFDYCEKGITEAFNGFSKSEILFIAAFLKEYPHIYYVELIRRVYGVEIWKKVDNYQGDIKRINWEYHKYFHHQYVGPFFYIDNEIKAFKTDVSEGNIQDDFINGPISHFDYFKSLGIDDDYGHYPRGRVIYNNKTNEYYLYIDKSLSKNKEIIDSVMNEFNLYKLNVVIKTDSHYTHDYL